MRPARLLRTLATPFAAILAHLAAMARVLDTQTSRVRHKLTLEFKPRVEQLDDRIVPSVSVSTLVFGPINVGQYAGVTGLVSAGEPMSDVGVVYAWGNGDSSSQDYPFSPPTDTCPIGIATYYYTEAGTYTITTTANVTYSGGGTDTGSDTNSITVDKIPLSTLGISFGPGGLPSLVAGESFSMEADAEGLMSPDIDPTGSVTFTATNTSTMAAVTLGTVTLSDTTTAGDSASNTISTALAAGSYTITASYPGDGAYETDSATGSLTVLSSPLGFGPSNPPDLVPAPTSCSCSGPVVSTIGAPAAATSNADVSYGDGGMKLTSAAMSEDAFGTSYGENVTYTNISGYGDPGNISGSGNTQTQAPHLVDLSGTNSIGMVTNSNTCYDFDYNSFTSVYTARFGDNLSLTTTTIGGYSGYIVTDGGGDTFTFYGFGLSEPTGRAGELTSMSDPNGDSTSVTAWSSNGEPATVEQTNGTDSIEFVSSYLSSGPNSGLLNSVVEQTQVGDGSWQTVETTNYTYYTSSNTYGTTGELMTALTLDSGSNLLSAYYYRYYTSGSSSGLLEYSFSTAAYERIEEVFGTSLDSYSNSDLSPYADTYLQYNSSGQVSEAVDAGAGCSVCSGGLGTYSYTYSTNTSYVGVIDPNIWYYKTVETLPDGNENIVYTNYTGQTILSIYEDTTSDQQWLTYNQYNGVGEVILTANPSAMTGYSESDGDLVGWSDGAAAYISSDSGLIDTYTYASSTTATTTTAGSVTGDLQESYIEQGTAGSPIAQQSYTYIANTVSGNTVYQTASATVYQNSDGSGAETTTYSYVYYSGTNQLYSETTTSPVVSTGDNGSGSANSTTTIYSTSGQVIWSKDANGSLSYTAYDPLTGAVTEQIQDVKTSITSDFTALPSGWSTPSSSLNLVTTYQVDSLGRTIKETDPNGNITYTTFDDADNEVRTYPGWNSDTDTPTGPTQVMIDDMALGYTETLTMTAAPAVIGRRADRDRGHRGRAVAVPQLHQRCGAGRRDRFLFQSGWLVLYERRARDLGHQLLRHHLRL